MLPCNPDERSRCLDDVSDAESGSVDEGVLMLMSGWARLCRERRCTVGLKVPSLVGLKVPSLVGLKVPSLVGLKG